MKKKLLGTLAVMTILLGGLSQVHAAETNYDIGFKFLISSYQSNSFTSSRKRSTTNPKCAWMVDFRNSTESVSGERCKTRFWLERPYVLYGTQVSDDIDILEDSAPQFLKSTEEGTNCNVQLGAENNNYNASTYEATGYWDEETAKIIK